MPYAIVYSPEVVDHLTALTKAQQVQVLDEVQAQLTHQPTLPTRRRKFLRPNALAQWELRVGDMRVFYDVEEAVESESKSEEKSAIVIVKAVGIKERNVLRIGGVRIDL
jgi:mRNA-degrading endonuclease RelE of RelBE toxin-antitoxin system